MAARAFQPDGHITLAAATAATAAADFHWCFDLRGLNAMPGLFEELDPDCLGVIDATLLTDSLVVIAQIQARLLSVSALARRMSAPAGTSGRTSAHRAQAHRTSAGSIPRRFRWRGLHRHVRFTPSGASLQGVRWLFRTRSLSPFDRLILRYEEIVHLCNECPSPRHGRRPESKPKPAPRAASATVLNVDLLDALLPPTGEPRHSEYGTDAFWRRVDTYAARLHGASRPSVGRADGDAAIERQHAPLAGQRGDGGVSPANGPAVGGAHRSTARFALLGRAIAELDALADGVRCAELKVRCAAPRAALCHSGLRGISVDTRRYRCDYA
jgi:hypothetical protein